MTFYESVNIDDLAFDIRALWHMTFMNPSPLSIQRNGLYLVD
jgi:hypothetical protein